MTPEIESTPRAAGKVHLSNVPAASSAPPIKALVRDLNFYYGTVHALKNINLEIAEKRVTALIGPSGCGKTTYLRCLTACTTSTRAIATRARSSCTRTT